MSQTDQDLSLLADRFPIAAGPCELSPGIGLIIVDEVVGFAAVGGGNLAPPVPNDQVSRMVAETDKLARLFDARGWPIAAFLDTHKPGKPEPPYLTHCEQGSGEEELVTELKWLEQSACATLVRKDCINGFVGAINTATGKNAIVDWVVDNKLTRVLVVGICTDICVMDFVLTFLSARNHGMMASLQDILVYEPGCATYDISAQVQADLDLPITARHPQVLAHHMGLYFMASRGAVIVDRVLGP